MSLKPAKRKAQVDRALQAVLGSNHICVVCLDPSGVQLLMNWKTGRVITPSPQLVHAVHGIAHRWTICVASLCEWDRGRYVKSTEVKPVGVHRADRMAEVIEPFYRQVIQDSNPNHRVGSGWIAVPKDVEMDEGQVFDIFESAKGWDQGYWNLYKNTVGDSDD